MKKLFLFAAFAVLGLTSINAQGQFKGGISAGLPVGDASDFATFSLVVDFAYMFEVSESFDLGPTIGYSHSFGDTFDTPFISVEFDDIQFLPIAVAGRYNLSEKFTLGVDLGYAIGINDGNDGGFYYAPRAQYGVSEKLDIVLSYRGVSLDGGDFSAIFLGIEFGF